jgi:hypothetical protein
LGGTTAAVGVEVQHQHPPGACGHGGTGRNDQPVDRAVPVAVAGLGVVEAAGERPGVAPGRERQDGGVPHAAAGRRHRIEQPLVPRHAAGVGQVPRLAGGERVEVAGVVDGSEFVAVRRPRFDHGNTWIVQRGDGGGDDISLGEGVEVLGGRVVRGGVEHGQVHGCPSRSVAVGLWEVGRHEL